MLSFCVYKTFERIIFSNYTTLKKQVKALKLSILELVNDKIVLKQY